MCFHGFLLLFRYSVDVCGDSVLCKGWNVLKNK